ncbi:hypothetical protein, partial [Arthrobacter sp. AQ5-05]|uniref:hypothetical protein n=1 Tax=Arthrobacter sp. AQ5-05 TaxID=2184581 RepID=UPI001C65E221
MASLFHRIGEGLASFRHEARAKNITSVLRGAPAPGNGVGKPAASGQNRLPPVVSSIAAGGQRGLPPTVTLELPLT